MTRLEGQVLDGYGKIVGSGLLIEGGKVTQILPSDPTVTGWITPGFIDIHCHGGGGASFPDDPSEAGVSRAVLAHRSMGTTALMASTVSLVEAESVIEGLVVSCEKGELAGIHLEGPYISPQKIGAQNPEAVRNPDLVELRSWLEAGKGHIKMMTIAPEVENAFEAAKLLLDYGAVPSWGHTMASSATTKKIITQTTEYAEAIGFSRPPQMATHLFNAMPPLGHREPGPVRELISAARNGEAVVELVADTVHVHPDLVGDVVNIVTRDNPLGVVFVTDAMQGAGMPDGRYTLGGLAVDIREGIARLAHGGAIAGGTARILEEVQRMVRGGHLSLGQAVRAAVAAPAHAMGFNSNTAGVSLTFEVGKAPNLVVLDDDLELVSIFREGQML